MKNQIPVRLTMKAMSKTIKTLIRLRQQLEREQTALEEQREEQSCSSADTTTSMTRAEAPAALRHSSSSSTISIEQFGLDQEADDYTSNEPIPISFPSSSSTFQLELESPPQLEPDIVAFHPEEIADRHDFLLTPLRPEEADECQLAEYLQGDDLSFLVEQQRYGIISGRSLERKEGQIYNCLLDHDDHVRHSIPFKDIVTALHYTKNGNKRRRLSD